MIVMSEISFEKRLFKGFVLPGVAVGVLLVLLLFVQPWISTDLLTRRIGGPAGMTIGFAVMPFSFLFMEYMMVAIVYAVIHGYLNDVEVSKVQDWELRLYEKMEAEHDGLLNRLESGLFTDDDVKELEEALASMRR